MGSGMPGPRRHPKPENQQLSLRLVRDSKALRLLTTAELRRISDFLKSARAEISDALKRVDDRQ